MMTALQADSSFVVVWYHTKLRLEVNDLWKRGHLYYVTTPHKVSWKETAGNPWTLTCPTKFVCL